MCASFVCSWKPWPHPIPLAAAPAYGGFPGAAAYPAAPAAGNPYGAMAQAPYAAPAYNQPAGAYGGECEHVCSCLPAVAGDCLRDSGTGGPALSAHSVSSQVPTWHHTTALTPPCSSRNPGVLCGVAQLRDAVPHCVLIEH